MSSAIQQQYINPISTQYKNHSSFNQQQLVHAFKTILNFLYYFYLSYSIYFQLIALLLLAYISFTLGKKSLQQPIDKKVKQLLKLLKYKKYLYQALPKVQRKISNIKKIFITLALIIGSALITVSFMEQLPKQYQIQILSITGALIVTPFILIYSYQFWLYKKQSQRKKYDDQINKKTIEFIQFLGPKVQLTIKNNVSKQTIKKNQRPVSSVCIKKECQKQRGLLKDRHQSLKYFIQSVLGFEWCSACKRRKPFDQVLAFEAPIFKGQYDDQQQQAKARIQFLLQGLGQMFNWINTIDPCNCSKLYWTLSTKEIRKYKNIQKQINDGLQKMQRGLNEIKK